MAPASTPANPRVLTRPRPKMRLDGDELRIRMYGQGVGDCFLLALPRRRGPGARTPARPVYVLIDCGVVGGTPGGPGRMKRVVADVAAATGGRLDLLVISHEHWDHLSGFIQAADEWQGIQVDALWLGWTEKPGTGLPDALRRIIDRQNRAITNASLAVQQYGLAERHETLIGLASFLGDPSAEHVPGFAAAPGVSDAFRAAKAKVPAEQHVFCEPGDVHRVPGSDVSAYVLGPPRDDDRLRQLNPSRNKPQTYTGPEGSDGRSGPGMTLRFVADGRSDFNAVAMPLIAMGGPASGGGDSAAAAAEDDALARSFPFDRTVRIPLPQVESAVRAEPGTYGALDSYYDSLSHWRRIDHDWLSSAEPLALRADNLTNNTSLVLAFELPARAAGGNAPILLFAGDAQVGNWLSWDDIRQWRLIGDARPTQPQPNITELLGRTAFYKVGHHGSHNGTLKENGVERMPSNTATRPMTAFVPVSPGVARKLKHWAEMPLDSLLRGLSERAPGRVILPNGLAWDAATAAASVAPADGPRVTTSDEKLPAVFDKDGVEVQETSPLWVELAIGV